MAKITFPVTAGTVISFDGVELKGAVSWGIDPGSCSAVDATDITAAVKGTGYGSRVWRKVEPGPVDPPTAEVSCLGSPVVTRDEIGAVGTLSIAGPWGSISGQAFATSAPASGSVGDISRFTISFQFTG
jgi:hypothetical protein